MSEPILLRDRPDLALASIIVDLDRRPELAAILVGVFGHALPTPPDPAVGDPLAIWRGPADLLLIGTPAAIASLVPAIESALADAPHFLEYSDAGLALIELAGEGLHALLPLPDSPPPGPRRSAVTRLADLRVTMLRHEGAEQRLWLIVDRASADYLRAWLARRIEIARSAPITP